MISTPWEELVIDTVISLTLAKWETLSGPFGGYLSSHGPEIGKLDSFGIGPLALIVNVEEVARHRLRSPGWPCRRRRAD
jgi:hypothetical protein